MVLTSFYKQLNRKHKNNKISGEYTKINEKKYLIHYLFFIPVRFTFDTCSNGKTDPACKSIYTLNI